MAMGRPLELYGPKASILITGASSGIGAAIAEYLGTFGGQIALFARRRERLEATAQRVASAGGTPLILVGDTTRTEDVRRAHAELVERQGPVDIAFLNAGVGDSHPLRAFSAARLRQVFEVNVLGVGEWLEVLLPPMIARRRGVLAGISSLAAHRGAPLSGAYSASKAALSTLLESVRIEARRLGVQVSTVEPGFVRSEITAKNRFRMPFLMDAPDAARLICDAVADGRAIVRFPRPMAAATRVLRHLPVGLYDRLAARMLDRGQRNERADLT